MNIDFLAQQLSNMENPRRDNRQRVANLVVDSRDLFEDLVTLTFKIDDKASIKAAWVLEWICTHHSITWILPYIETFVQNIQFVTLDSATRPCAKICEHLAVAYTSKKENLVKEVLTTKHIDLIIETGFDWLITPQKIAVRAYTMNTLYLFGLQKDWVHPELEHLIRTKIIHESKGCKARGRKILEIISK